MLTGAFADRGKPIFAVGVPLAPAPNRAVDLDEDGAATGGELAADANAADAAAPLLSDRLLTMRAAFMERINRHMGAAAAEAEEEDEEDEDEDMGEEGGASKQQQKKKENQRKGGSGRAKAPPR